MKTPWQKLSKADGDTSIRDLRADGASAPAIIGRAAHAAGLIPAVAPLRADAAPDLPPLRELAARLQSRAV